MGIEIEQKKRGNYIADFASDVTNRKIEPYERVETLRIKENVRSWDERVALPDTWRVRATNRHDY
jgi:hypothetical protein